MVARQLLDLDEAEAGVRGLRPGSGSRAGVGPGRSLDFHAGWIALALPRRRARGGEHFALAAVAADTPLSIARAELLARPRRRGDGRRRRGDAAL